jgi:adenine-specific DNA-methyltransferase
VATKKSDETKVKSPNATEPATYEEALTEIARLRHLIHKFEGQGGFGLVWEDRPERVEQLLLTEIPILAADRALDVSGEQPAETPHALVVGDNLHALHTLQATHRELVDVIYIDPPYNTGNQDFMYNDRYVDAEDTFRHSKWLSFMSKRLYLAKDLLKASGMFFCSIDDNELASLRLLLDSIFGDENFINCISVFTKSSAGASGGGEDKKFKKNIEYLLVYAKDREHWSMNQIFEERNLVEVIAEKEDAGKSFEYRQVLVNAGEKKKFGEALDGSGNPISIFQHTGYQMKSVRQLAKEEGLTEIEIYVKYFDLVHRVTNAQTSIRTRVNDATKQDPGLFSIEYVPRSGKSKGKLTTSWYFKNDLVVWLSDVAEKKGSRVIKREKIGTLWSDLSWNGLAAEGGVTFENGKKPVKFLKRVIGLCTNENALVLDFFAGSGTTAQAVMELNMEDGGNRRAIIVTNNESGICDSVTYPRIKGVLTGNLANGRTMTPLAGSLAYFRTDFITRRKNHDRMRSDISKHTIDLVAIKEGATRTKAKDNDLTMLFGRGKSVAVVTSLYPDHVALRADADKAAREQDSRHAYLFTWSDQGIESETVEVWEGWQVEPLPAEMLAALRRLAPAQTLFPIDTEEVEAQ